MVLGLSTDPVLVGPHHARAELVENLKGRLPSGLSPGRRRRPHHRGKVAGTRVANAGMGDRRGREHPWRAPLYPVCAHSSPSGCGCKPDRQGSIQLASDKKDLPRRIFAERAPSSVPMNPIPKIVDPVHAVERARVSPSSFTFKGLSRFPSHRSALLLAITVDPSSK